MTSAFYIAHATDGRTRIRWAGDTSEKTRILEIAENIADVPGVDKALPRITTGSIIIEHDEAEWPALEPLLADRLSLEFTKPAPPQSRSGLHSLNRGLDKVDEKLRSINTDLPSVAVFLLIMLAIAQALRGQVIGNSMSFIWYALSIATMTRGVSGTPPDTEPNISE